MRIGGIRNVKGWTGEGLARVMIRDVQRLRSGRLKRAPKLVFSLNGECAARAATDCKFLGMIEQADIVHADGMSAVWASRLHYRTGAKERVATTDFIWTASRAGKRDGVRIYLLGARADILSDAAHTLRAAIPGIEIVGMHHGYFEEQDEPAIVADIVASGAEVVWVGLGRPRQEAFCVRNRSALTSVAWLKTCGGAFDFCAGRASRAPVWMQRLGLEWLYRTLREPLRLGPRYISTNGRALWLFLFRSGPLRRRRGS